MLGLSHVGNTGRERKPEMKTALTVTAFIGAWSFAENVNTILPGWLVAAGSIAAILTIPVGLFLIVRKMAR